MPLPTDGPLSLQGHLRQGDTEYSKPKQAMIMRLTTEMLERLESLPPGRTHESGIKVEFGDNTGIYIGEEFYPTRVQPEAAPHELYMKPDKGALKLHANIVGRVLFVDRKLGEKVQTSVREKTEAAEKQRTESKIKILDAPPVLSNDRTVATKKRKAQPEARRTNGPITARDLSVPSSSQQSRVASPRPPPSLSRSTNAAHPGTRQRMIHFVALGHRTESEVHRCVGGNDISEAEKEILSRLLSEIAVPVPLPKGSSGVPTKWQLKPESWLDVRPYDWESLETDERTRLARTARSFLHQLRIPESDPAWSHVRPKGSESAVSAAKAVRKANGTATASEIKRPMMSSEQRKGKVPEASGRRGNDAIIAKDEGARARAEKEKERAAAAQSAPAPSRRRVPGSGFKATSNTPTPPADNHPQSSSAPASSSATVTRTVKRQNGAEGRESKREPPGPSSSASSRPTHPLPPPPHQQRSAASSTAPSAARIPKRDSDTASRVTESDRESRRGSPPPSTGSKRKKVREEGEYEPERESSIVSKRRKLAEDAERERERGGHATKASQSRDLALPKRPSATERGTMAPPKQKLKKEPSASPSLRPASPPVSSAKRSPLPSSASPMPSMRSPLSVKPPPQPDRVPSVSSTASHRSREEHSRHGSAKARRKSPIYTSSEDESESQPRVAIKKEDEEDVGVKPPVSMPAPTPIIPSELPKDFPGLQRLYHKIYPEYIKLYHERIAARERIKELLAWEPGEDDEEQDRNKIPCDDDEYEQLDLDNVREMNNKYLRLEAKLKAILEAAEPFKRDIRVRSGGHGNDSIR